MSITTAARAQRRQSLLAISALEKHPPPLCSEAVHGHEPPTIVTRRKAQPETTVAWATPTIGRVSPHFFLLPWSATPNLVLHHACKIVSQVLILNFYLQDDSPANPSADR